MSTIIGRFFFKLTTNGNLIGEYSNNKSTRCVTEAANRIFAVEDAEQITQFSFEASYESVWRESANNGVCSNLKVEGKKGCPGIYSLVWKALNGKVQFEGEGMLCDDVLIGNYWSVT